MVSPIFYTDLVNVQQMLAKNVKILRVISNLIATNPVDFAHFAQFSTSNPDVITAIKDLMSAKEIVNLEKLFVKN